MPITRARAEASLPRERVGGATLALRLLPRFVESNRCMGREAGTQPKQGRWNYVTATPWVPEHVWKNRFDPPHRLR
jgi:hypothetical protein